MSFLFGIIDFDPPIAEDDFLRLGQAIAGTDFTAHTHARLGFCTHPGRPAKAGFYARECPILLMGVRLYGHEGILTDTFAEAYAKEGPDCARRLNGDYAAIAIHTDAREMVLLRDHIGARPLVYARQGSMLIDAAGSARRGQCYVFGLGR